MSRLTEFHLYDLAVLLPLVREFRQANGNRKAIQQIITAASEPQFSPTRTAFLRKVLARFQALHAPEIVMQSCRRELEPRALMLERCAQGETPTEGDLHGLALRKKVPIAPAYDFVAWLADDVTRNAKPTPDRVDGWFGPFVPKDPVVLGALYGAEPLRVDGVATLGAERMWVLDLPALPQVRAFFEALVLRSPPPIDDYRVWYPHLHSIEAALSDAFTVPARGPLEWAYARELARAAAAIEAMVRMLRNCERRRWCIQVCNE